MENITELAKSLALAQGELQNAEKESSNPFYHSKYADLATILNCVRPVFSKHGLSIIQIPGLHEGHVTVKTILLHSSGQSIEGELSMPLSKTDAQGVGSAITYARRYALSAMAGITQEDDDANIASGKDSTKEKKLTHKQELILKISNAKVKGFAKDFNVFMEGELTKYNTDLEGLNEIQAMNIMNLINSKKDWKKDA